MPIPPAIAAITIPPLNPGRFLPSRRIIRTAGKSRAAERKIHKEEKDGNPCRDKIEQVVHPCCTPADPLAFIAVSDHSIHGVRRTVHCCSGKPENGEEQERGDDTVCQVFRHGFDSRRKGYGGGRAALYHGRPAVSPSPARSRHRLSVQPQPRGCAPPAIARQNSSSAGPAPSGRYRNQGAILSTR